MVSPNRSYFGPDFTFDEIGPPGLPFLLKNCSFSAICFTLVPKCETRLFKPSGRKVRVGGKTAVMAVIRPPIIAVSWVPITRLSVLCSDPYL